MHVGGRTSPFLFLFFFPSTMLDREEKKKMYNTGIRQPKHAGGGAGERGREGGRQGVLYFS